MAECFRLLRNRTVLLCTLGVACFIAADVGIGFVSVRLIDNPDSILTTTGFYALRIVGTLVGAWVLIRVVDVKYLRWNMLLALALCIALFAVRSEAVVYALVGILGFTMACVFATFLCRGDQECSGPFERSRRTDDPGHFRRCPFGPDLRCADPQFRSSPGGLDLGDGLCLLPALGRNRIEIRYQEIEL